jgi:hypothetical protein
MRRLILIPTVAALAALPLAAPPASAAPVRNCSPVKATINGTKYVLAIKVKVRGLPCPATGAFWTAFATGEQGSSTTEDLRKNCGPGSKGQQKAAEKKKRFAYKCTSSDGTIRTTAWVLGG